MPPIFEEFFSEYDFEDNYNLINSFVTTYNLALGEFDFGAYNARGEFSQVMLWLLFLFATFLLQITFMNMLIAIMTEIYDQVTAEDAQSSASERISLLTDYSFFLDNFNLGLDAQYLYVV